jgi:hypothetical protein
MALRPIGDILALKITGMNKDRFCDTHARGLQYTKKLRDCRPDEGAPPLDLSTIKYRNGFFATQLIEKQVVKHRTKETRL